MAQNIQSQNIQSGPAQGVAAPQNHIPPSARELRAQAVQRLQVGLFGLAAMLLLVALANIIMDKALQAEGSRPETAQSSASEEKVSSDPLVEAGVAPAAEPSASSKPAGGGR